MTDNTQPEALRLADELEDEFTQWRISNHTGRKAATELRRLHTENTTFQQGYAAARLEIESLQARIKTMAEEHADELMVAHLDGRMRVAQPAGAQQSGVAYAALPDADRDYMRKVVAVAVTMLFDGYKEDVTRVFSTGELSEFVTITAAMGGERVEDIYRRAWDLLSLPVRASHWQAPVCAAPDVSGYVSEWSGGLCTSDEAMDGIAKLYAAQPAGAQQPTTQPAPQQEAPAMPSGWVSCTIEFDGSGPEEVAYGPKIMMDRLAKWLCKHFERTIAEKAAPQPLPASQGDALDAARLDWLLLHISGAEFRRIGVHYSGNARRADVDAARKQGANHD